MNKHTANSMQFIGRVGNASTKPSARGINLLGWGEAEGPLSDDERREILKRKVQAMQALLPSCRTKADRAAVGRDIAEINRQICELKGERKHGRDLSNFICDVVKENVPRLTWERWCNEARERQKAADTGRDQ